MAEEILEIQTENQPIGDEKKAAERLALFSTVLKEIDPNRYSSLDEKGLKDYLFRSPDNVRRIRKALEFSDRFENLPDNDEDFMVLLQGGEIPEKQQQTQETTPVVEEQQVQVQPEPEAQPQLDLSQFNIFNRFGKRKTFLEELQNKQRTVEEKPVPEASTNEQQTASSVVPKLLRPITNIPTATPQKEGVAALPNYKGLFDSPTAKQFSDTLPDDKYRYGAKDLKGKDIDCSGAVCHVLKMKGIEYDPNTTNAAKLYSSAKTKNIPVNKSADGDIIVMDIEGKGIDHIGFVVRDKEGNLGIAESSSSYNGTTITPLKERIENLKQLHPNMKWDIASVDKNRKEPPASQPKAGTSLTDIMRQQMLAGVKSTQANRPLKQQIELTGEPQTGEFKAEMVNGKLIYMPQGMTAGGEEFEDKGRNVNEDPTGQYQSTGVLQRDKGQTLYEGLQNIVTGTAKDKQGLAFDSAQQKRDKDRPWYKMLFSDLPSAIGKLADNAYNNILAGTTFLEAKQRSLLTFGERKKAAEDNEKEVKKRIGTYLEDINKKFANDLKENNIQTSLIDAVKSGEYKRLPEATLYNIGQAVTSMLPAAFTGGYSMFAQTLADGYINGVKEKAKETNQTPEQVIENGDDAELIPIVSSTIQAILEKFGSKVAGNAIASKGGYKAIRDWVIQQTGNKTWSRIAGTGVGLTSKGLHEGGIEVLQEITAITSEQASGANTAARFMQKLPKALTSEEGKSRIAESFVGGVVGAGGLIAGGKIIRSAKNPVDAYIRLTAQGGVGQKATGDKGFDAVFIASALDAKNELQKQKIAAIAKNPTKANEIAAEFDDKINKIKLPSTSALQDAYLYVQELPQSEYRDQTLKTLEQHLANRGMTNTSADVENPITFTPATPPPPTGGTPPPVNPQGPQNQTPPPTESPVSEEEVEIDEAEYQKFLQDNQLSEERFQGMVDDVVEGRDITQFGDRYMTMYGMYKDQIEEAANQIKAAMGQEAGTDISAVETKLNELRQRFIDNGKSESEADELALNSISDQERQLLRDAYNQDLKNKQQQVVPQPINIRTLPDFNDTGVSQSAYDVLDAIDFSNPQSIKDGIDQILAIVNNKAIPDDKIDQVLSTKAKLIGNQDYRTKEYLEKYIGLSTKDFTGIDVNSALNGIGNATTQTASVGSEAAAETTNTTGGANVQPGTQPVVTQPGGPVVEGMDVPVGDNETIIYENKRAALKKELADKLEANRKFSERNPGVKGEKQIEDQLKAEYGRKIADLDVAEAERKNKLKEAETPKTEAPKKKAETPKPEAPKAEEELKPNQRVLTDKEVQDRIKAYEQDYTSPMGHTVEGGLLKWFKDRFGEDSDEYKKELTKLNKLKSGEPISVTFVSPLDLINKPISEMTPVEKDVNDLFRGVGKGIRDSQDVGAGKNLGQVDQEKKDKKAAEKQEIRAERDTELDAKKKAILERMAKRQGGKLNTGIDPEDLADALEFMGLSIEGGAYKISDIVKDAAELLGEMTDKMLRAIKAGYNAYRGDENTSDDIADQMDDEKTVRNFKIENDGIVSNNGSQKPSNMDGGESTGETKEPGSNKQTENISNRKGTDGNEGSETGGGDGEKGGRGTGSGDGNNTGTSNRGGGTRGSNAGSRSEQNLGGTNLNSKNFQITPDVELIPKGEINKIRANIRAITIAKQLRDENRDATEEEKKALAQYTGFGGLANVLKDDWYTVNRDEAWKSKYLKHQEDLKAIMTADEYRAAINSTINAHYTDRKVVSALWDMAERLGFKGGKVLEPSVGTGNFFGLMPKNLSSKSNLTAYELDPITALIASKLYPDADIFATGYENSTEKNNSQDLVISNVPFGKTAPYDKQNKELSKFNLHNYFIAKGIRKLKPGGLGIFITSSATMDGANGKFRTWATTEGNADFIGAIRLPNNAFKENAGTEVTTDIVIYRKRTGSSTEMNQQNLSIVPFSETETKEGKPINIEINEYFANNPEMMLGEMQLAYQSNSGGLYGADSQTLVSDMDSDQMAAAILDRINRLPANIFGSDGVSNYQSSEQKVASELKEGSLVNQNGQPMVVENGQMVMPDWGTTQVKGTVPGKSTAKTYNGQEVALDYIRIKQAITELTNAERDPAYTDETLDPLRKRLNEAYDIFVSKYGALNRNKKIEFLEDDSEYLKVFSLENISKKGIIGPDGKEKITVDIDKTPIFKRRVNFPVVIPTIAENVEDALNISMSYKGDIDVSMIANLLNISKDEATKQLIDSGLVYENPTTGLLEDSDEYLSGPVRTKLEEAKKAAEADEKFLRNVKSLEEVLPKDIPAQLVEYRLGSTWIPPQYIEDFLRDILKVDAKVKYSEPLSRWKVVVNYGLNNAANTTTYGTKYFDGTDLVEKALNLTSPIAYDPGPDKTRIKNEAATAEAQAKVQEINDAFVTMLKSNEESSNELARIYNDFANNYVETKYRLPSWDYYPGAAQTNDKGREIKLRTHQRRAVQRAIKQSVLLAHSVGTGKTFTMITAAMELKRLGLAKKPMIVVQNATLEQFAKSFKDLYPAANILAPTKKEMDSENRQRLFNKIAYGDWDAIIIPQSFLNYIPDDPIREIAYINEQIEQLKEAQDELGKEDKKINNILAKEVDKLRERLEEIAEGPKKKKSKVKDEARANLSQEKKLQKQKDRKIDDISTFEQMGVDALMLDEAHAYKKLGIQTKMSNVRGIDTMVSKRAFGAMMKVRYIQEKNNGRNVILATGTPITNTMAEAYTMMRFVAPQILEQYKIKHFDQFASTYGQVEPSLEFTSTGSFKTVDRFKSYINAPELLRAFRANTDVVLTEDVSEFKEGNDIPKLKNQKIKDGESPGFTQFIIPQSKGLEKVMDGLKQTVRNYEAMSGAEKRENRHIPLVVFTRAKQAAIDLRLLNPNAEDDPGSKTNKVVEQALRIYKESSELSGTQMIFSDSYQSPEGVGTGPRFNLYQDIKRKLIAGGIPAEQIAVINDYTDKKREKLFDDINSGKVRILLGSTEKMGVGVNAQERMVGLHHMDAPPRPMDFEQRNGRILRQGNIHALLGMPVEVLVYGVEKTLDATAYQRLAIKQKFINQIMKGENLDRVMGDFDDENPADMTFDEMMANLSGSQYALLLNQKKFDLKKLEMAEQNHARRLIEIAREIKNDTETIIRYTERQIEEDKKILKVKPFLKDDGSFKIEKVVINKKELPLDQWKKELDEMIDSVKPGGGTLINFNFNDGITGSGTILYNAVSNKPILYYRLKNIGDYELNSKDDTLINTANGLGMSVSSLIEKEGKESSYLNNRANEISSGLATKKELLNKPFDKADKLKATKEAVDDLTAKMKAEMDEKEKAEIEKMKEMEFEEGGESISDKMLKKIDQAIEDIDSGTLGVVIPGVPQLVKGALKVFRAAIVAAKEYGPLTAKAVRDAKKKALDWIQQQTKNTTEAIQEATKQFEKITTPINPKEISSKIVKAITELETDIMNQVSDIVNEKIGRATTEEGIKAGRNEVKNVLRTIFSGMKTKLTSGQLNTIMAKVPKTNSLKALANFIYTAANVVHQGEMHDNLEAMKKSILKIMNGPFVTKQDKDALIPLIKALNVNDLKGDAISEFAEIMKELGTTRLGQELRTTNRNDIASWLKNQIDNAAEAKELIRERLLKERYEKEKADNKIPDTMTLDEFKQYLEGRANLRNESRKAQASINNANVKAELQDVIPLLFLMAKEAFYTGPWGSSPIVGRAIESASKLKLDYLSIQELRHLQNILADYVDTGDFSNLGVFAATADAEKAIKEIAPFASQYRTYSGQLQKKNFSNMAGSISKTTEAANKFREVLLQKEQINYGKAIRKVQAAIKDIEDFAMEKKFTERELRTVEIYNILKQSYTQGNTWQEWQERMIGQYERYIKLKEAEVKDTKTKSIFKNVYEEQVRDAKETLSALQAFNDLENLEDGISDDQKEMHNKIVDAYRSELQAFKETSMAYYGIEIPEGNNNYVPLNPIYRFPSGTDIAEGDVIDEDDQELTEAQFELHQINKQEAGTTIKRTPFVKNDVVYGTDLISNFSKRFYQTAYQNQVSHDLFVMSKLLNSSKFREIISPKDSKTNIDALKEMMQGIISAQRLSGYMAVDRRSFLKRLSGGSLASVIVSMWQPLKQGIGVVPILARVPAAITGKAITSALMPTPAIDNFMESVTTLPMRSTFQSESDIKKRHRRLNEFGGQTLFKNVVNKTGDVTTDIRDWMAAHTIEPSDRFVTRAALLAGYIYSLEKQGINIDNIDWDNEAKNPNMEALAAAENLADQINVPSDQTTKAEVLKTQKTDTEVTGRELNWMLASFDLNAFQDFYNNYRTVFAGKNATTKEKKEAVTNMISQLSNSLFYQSISMLQYVVEGMAIELAYRAYQGADYEPPDDEDWWNQFKTQALIKAITGPFGLLIGGVGNATKTIYRLAATGAFTLLQDDEENADNKYSISNPKNQLFINPKELPYLEMLTRLPESALDAIKGGDMEKYKLVAALATFLSGLADFQRITNKVIKENNQSEKRRDKLIKNIKHLDKNPEERKAMETKMWEYLKEGKESSAERLLKTVQGEDPEAVLEDLFKTAVDDKVKSKYGILANDEMDYLNLAYGNVDDAILTVKYPKAKSGTAKKLYSDHVLDGNIKPEYLQTIRKKYEEQAEQQKANIDFLIKHYPDYSEALEQYTGEGGKYEPLADKAKRGYISNSK